MTQKRPFPICVTAHLYPYSNKGTVWFGIAAFMKEGRQMVYFYGWEYSSWFDFYQAVYRTCRNLNRAVKNEDSFMVDLYCGWLSEAIIFRHDITVSAMNHHYQAHKGGKRS